MTTKKPLTEKTTTKICKCFSDMENNYKDTQVDHKETQKNTNILYGKQPQRSKMTTKRCKTIWRKDKTITDMQNGFTDFIYWLLPLKLWTYFPTFCAQYYFCIWRLLLQTHFWHSWTVSFFLLSNCILSTKFRPNCTQQFLPHLKMIFPFQRPWDSFSLTTSPSLS